MILWGHASGKKWAAKVQPTKTLLTSFLCWMVSELCLEMFWSPSYDLCKSQKLAPCASPCAQSALRKARRAKHFAQSNQRTAFCAKHLAHSTLRKALCAQPLAQRTLCTALCAKRFLQCTLRKALCAKRLFKALCAKRFAQSTLRKALCAKLYNQSGPVQVSSFVRSGSLEPVRVSVFLVRSGLDFVFVSVRVAKFGSGLKVLVSVVRSESWHILVSV